MVYLKVKVNQEVQRSPLLPTILRKVEPLHTKKYKEKKEKKVEWKKILNKVIKVQRKCDFLELIEDE